MNNSKDWSKLSKEELEKELDKSSDQISFTQIVKIDGLNIVDKLDRIHERITSILKTRTGVNTASAKIRELYVESRYKAACTESFFKEPPREYMTDLRAGPIACVYDKHGQLTYVNNSYIVASGLIDFVRNEPEKWKSLIGSYRYNNREMTLDDHVKFLATEKELVPELASAANPKGIEVPKLYTLLYSMETIKRIYKRFEQLDTVGGYTDVFEMKLTGKQYLWKTLKNRYFDGNIRSAIEVTRDSSLIKRLKDERDGIIKKVDCESFGFYKTVEKFKKMCDIIMKGKFDNQFREFLEFATVGDTFIDESYYATLGFDGQKYNTNKQFLLNSIYTSTERVNEAVANDSFKNGYYGPNGFKNTRESMSQMMEEPEVHFNETVGAVVGITSGGTLKKVDINYDHFNIDGPNYNESDYETRKFFKIGVLL